MITSANTSITTAARIRYKILHLVMLFFSLLLLAGCNSGSTTDAGNSPVKVAGAMRDVMWKGELGGSISLDTLNRKGLYGLGPTEGLRGELLILDGRSYLSRVVNDSTMSVEETYWVKAPFFVYANAPQMEKVELPRHLNNLQELEVFLDSTLTGERPQVFRLTAKAIKAHIHVQNLPPGAKVRSPQEAHAGQRDYSIQNREVELVGFYSTFHQGVFTHHDTHLHTHLLTKDRSIMGHVDEITFAPGTLKLFVGE